MIDVTDLKRHLGLDESDASYDPGLRLLERRVLDAVERETHRYFGPVRERRETLDGRGRTTLWLSEEPNEDVTLETRASISGDWSSFTEFEVDGRRLDAFVRFPHGRRNVRATYSDGYEEGQEPGDVRNMVLSLCAFFWKSRGKEWFASEKLGDFSYTRGQVMEVPGASDFFARWRRGRV